MAVWMSPPAPTPPQQLDVLQYVLFQDHTSFKTRHPRFTIQLSGFSEQMLTFIQSCKYATSQCVYELELTGRHFNLQTGTKCTLKFKLKCNICVIWNSLIFKGTQLEHDRKEWRQDSYTGRSSNRVWWVSFFSHVMLIWSDVIVCSYTLF